MVEYMFRNRKLEQALGLYTPWLTWYFIPYFLRRSEPFHSIFLETIATISFLISWDDQNHFIPYLLRRSQQFHSLFLETIRTISFLIYWDDHNNVITYFLRRSEPFHSLFLETIRTKLSLEILYLHKHTQYTMMVIL